MVDATTQTALEQPVIYWRMLVYADVDGDVLRATTGLYPKTVSGSGDSDLDGTYEPYDERLVNISSVGQNETGSDSLTISLNGLIVGSEYLFDRDEEVIQDRFGDYIRMRGSSFLNTIGDKARWQGRIARVWFYLVDENETQVGDIIPMYTGYMNEISIGGSADQQLVTMVIENYITTLAGSQNKNYLSQSQYDSNDQSAAATISAANGIQSAGSSNIPSTPNVPNTYPPQEFWNNWSGY